MNRLFPVIAFTLLLSSSLRSQESIGSVPAARAAALSSDGPYGIEGSATMDLLSNLPPGTVALSYMDTSTQRLLWRVQANYPDFSMINIGERFTLPTAWGRLDSIAVLLTELPLGEIRFDVWADTLRFRKQGDPAPFHYPSYFLPPDRPLDSARLKAEDRDTLGFTIVRFQGRVVPQEFHVVISPAVAGGFQSLFAVLSDSKLGDESTIAPEIARSIFLANVQGIIVPFHMHGFFGASGAAVAPDLYMIAFVTIDPSSATDSPSAARLSRLEQNYPNPVMLSESPVTNIGFYVAQHGHVTLEVIDAFGRRIRTIDDQAVLPGWHQRQFNASGLPSGTYVLAMRTPQTLQMRPFSVVK